MRFPALAALVALSFVCFGSLFRPRAPAAEDSPERAKKTEESPTGAPGDERALRRAELERKFQETLSHATLEGKWRLIKEGELGEERPEKYTLGEVKKIDGSRWTIEARIQYGEKDVRIPVPVEVLWAGDTPVITVDELWIPALGKYSARVLVYNGLYSGAWFGVGYGGLLSGRIVEGAPAADSEGDSEGGKKAENKAEGE